jgi:membrane fusion protein, multidrug efflux system
VVVSPSKLNSFLTSCAILVLFLFSSCSGSKGTPPAVPVTAEKAVARDVPQVISAIGSVEPFTSVTVKALVNGELQGVHFKEGSDVKKGDLLFVIDPRPYNAALKQAEADLIRAKAQASAAKSNAARSSDLIKEGYIASQQFDDVAAQSDSLQAEEKAAEAAVDSALLNLSNCSIRAPMDCRTGNILVQQGNVVKANDTSLVVLNQIAPVYVSFSVPEQQLDGIRAALSSGKVPVTAATSGGNPVSGELTFLNNQVDTGTGSILLKATFANEYRTMWPGQFVNLDITLGTLKNAVIIPTQALQAGQQGSFVYIVKEDMTVEPRQVKAGQALGGSTAIIEGIRPGETVVTDGLLRLGPGVKVEIRDGLNAPAEK